MKAKTTLHARQRMQQRAISELQTELLRYFGEDQYQKGGATITRMPMKRLKELRTALDKLDNIVMVKGDGDVVLTVMHGTKRVKTTALTT